MDSYAMCDNIFEEALEKFQKKIWKNKAIILSDNTWHIGIIGIVASKLSEDFTAQFSYWDLKKTQNPMLRQKHPGLNLYDTLCEAEEHFMAYSAGTHLLQDFSAEIEPQ